jgi:steroid 5-alpha reductase family enzyme
VAFEDHTGRRDTLVSVKPLVIVLIIAGVSCAFAWIASLVSGDTSWVDRLWSVVPVLYVWVFAAAGGLHDARLNVIALLVTIWGIRLTFNLARKGGYVGGEDYRWPILRQQMSRWKFQLFNFFFIVIYQNVILVLIALPALTAYQHRRSAFGIFDALLAALFLACTIGETVADNQQWVFQSAKKAVVAAGRTPDTQFLQSGLFRYSRHPNYFFELAQWWLLFFMGASAARSVTQWTVIGAFLLTLLFIGSTRFTEKISLSRYPEYAHYQHLTSPVVPWFVRQRALNSK